MSQQLTKNLNPMPANDPSLFPPKVVKRSLWTNERGQGLIEYLIIVALIAVATIGVMRVLGQAVTSRFATVSDALQGKKKTYAVDTIDDSLTNKKDLGDFMNGVDGNAGGSRGGSSGGPGRGFGGSSGSN